MKKDVQLRSRSAHNAFTLVEMLVVIAIVAILSALIFPVLARVREGGRKTVCQSNLKQLGLAFQMYQEDYNKRLPFAGNYQVWAGVDSAGAPATAWTGATAHWVVGGETSTGPKNYTDAEQGLADSAVPSDTNGHGEDSAYSGNDFKYNEGRQAFVEKGALYPYVKSAAVYVCPSVLDGDKKKLTYSMNCAIGGLSQVRVRTPDKIVLLVDEGKSLNDGYFWAVDNDASSDSLFTGHIGSGNLLFLDGHVKPMLQKEFILDWSTEGKANKSRFALTDSPRFHDAAFGYKNSAMAPSGKQNTCGDALPTTP